MNTRGLGGGLGIIGPLMDIFFKNFTLSNRAKTLASGIFAPIGPPNPRLT